MTFLDRCNVTSYSIVKLTYYFSVCFSVPSLELAGIITGIISLGVCSFIVIFICWKYPMIRSRTFWDRSLKRLIRRMYCKYTHFSFCKSRSKWPKLVGGFLSARADAPVKLYWDAIWIRFLDNKWNLFTFLCFSSIRYRVSNSAFMHNVSNRRFISKQVPGGISGALMLMLFWISSLSLISRIIFWTLFYCLNSWAKPALKPRSTIRG